MLFVNIRYANRSIEYNEIVICLEAVNDSYKKVCNSF